MNLPQSEDSTSVRALDKALFRMAGIREVEVMIVLGKIRVEFDPAILSLERIRDAMQRAISGGEAA